MDQKVDLIGGQVKALLNFAVVVINTHHDSASLKEHFEIASQVGLAMVEGQAVSDDFLAGMQDVNEQLVAAIQRILSGKKFLTETVAEKVAYRLEKKGTDIPLHELLSERELNVFKLLAAGHSVTEISVILNLRSTTVSTYRSRILEKMDMKTNVDIARYAMDNKLI